MSTVDLRRLKEELRNCSSMNEIVAKMDEYYNLDEELGPMAKGTVIMGIQKVIKITQVKPR